MFKSNIPYRNKKVLIQFLIVLFISLLIILPNLTYFSSTPSPFAFATFGFLASNPENSSPSEEQSGKLAIIIDDFGQNRNGVKEMMSIPQHLTFAVMPFLAFSQKDAENAYDKNYEVIVHLPMESYSGKLSWVGPRPILAVMGDNEVQEIVRDAFESVPHAVGANIHMGAKVGEDERIISAVLDVIKEKELYFVDSRSSKHPIAKKIANTKGVLCYDRNVFIDGKKPKNFILKELRRAGDIALEKGYAVAIGHVGTEGGTITAEAIMELLPEFASKKIELVFVSELP